MIALIDDGQLAVAHHRHALRIAPPHQRNFTQHVPLQCQLDQERVFTHHRIQGFGLWVVGQVRSLVLFHAGQRLGIDDRLVIRQPDTLLALGRAFKTLLQPKHPSVVPMHGERKAIGGSDHQQEPGIPSQGKARAASGFQRG
ncbi:hypothetical protein D3C84_753860 [compost metagenome]